jgi:hypothetical protein
MGSLDLPARTECVEISLFLSSFLFLLHYDHQRGVSSFCIAISEGHLLIFPERIFNGNSFQLFPTACLQTARRMILAQKQST